MWWSILMCSNDSLGDDAQRFPQCIVRAVVLILLTLFNYSYLLLIPSTKDQHSIWIERKSGKNIVVIVFLVYKLFWIINYYCITLHAIVVTGEWRRLNRLKLVNFNFQIVFNLSLRPQNLVVTVTAGAQGVTRTYYNHQLFL